MFCLNCLKTNTNPSCFMAVNKQRDIAHVHVKGIIRHRVTVNCFCLITLLCINKWAGPVYGPYLPRSCVLCKHAVVRWTLSTLHAAAADSVCVDARAVWLFTRLSHASTRWGARVGVSLCVCLCPRVRLCVWSEAKSRLGCYVRTHLGSRVCLCTMRARVTPT